MLSKSNMRDVIRVSLGIYLSGAVMLLIFLMSGNFSKEVFLGAVLGCTYSCLSFLFLAFSLEHSLTKGKAAATASVGSGYGLRLLGAALMIFWAIKAPYFNEWAAIIPLFFQRPVVMLLSFADSRKGVKKDEC